MNDYDLLDDMFGDFLEKQIAFSWTIVAMVLSAISNLIYDVNWYSIIYNIGIIMVSIFFSVFGHYILIWKQETENRDHKFALKRALLLGVIGCIIVMACLFFSGKSLIWTVEKYIINGLIPSLTFFYISIVSGSGAFGFFINAMVEADAIGKEKKDGDN